MATMMSRKTAKRIAAVVAFLLAAIMVFSVILSAIPYASAASSVSGLKQQLSDIASKKAAIQKQINALSDQIGEVSEKKAALDEQIELTQDEIDTTEHLIGQLEDQIDTKTEELAEAEDALDEKTDLFCTRIRVMYEEGDTTYLDVLLASENFSDMLTRIDTVGQIMQYDEQIVQEYTAAKEAIAQKKASLEADKTDQESYQASLQDKQDALDTQRAEQQQLIDKLSDDLDAQKAESERMDAERAAINDEIAEISRKAAEAAKSSSGSSNSGSSSVTVPVSGTFTWPLPGYGSGSITSPYGYRIHPITGTKKFHSGIDLGAPAGTTIVAAKAGTVVRSYMSSSYGNYTVIDHGGGVMTAYAHQSKRLVSVGDTVSAGEKIGLVGSTGNSTGNHLHFEIYVNGSTVNPMKYFS